MRVVDTETGIELGSLPDRIVDLMVGSHKGIHPIAPITAEVKEIQNNSRLSDDNPDNSAENEAQVYEPSARNDPRGDHCRECGADIAGRTARFCPHCGAEQ
jgi:rubrerythrin